MHSNSIHHEATNAAGAADAPDQDFLDEVFERAVRLVEDGLVPETDALLAGHEALRAEVERLVHLARHVAVGCAAPLPTLAGFTLLQQLGQGGMGTVYLARQHSLGGRPVALKVLPSGAALSPRSRARFLAEASAIARLRHPNIVAVHDVVHQDDVYAYAMEWIDGSSLAEVIERRVGRSYDPPLLEMSDEKVGQTTDPPYGIPNICRIGLAMARALEAVHAAGLLHRDVKPSNILLRRDGTPLLADFGLARELDSSVHTQAGHFAGTVAYAPPEQLRGDTPSPSGRGQGEGNGVDARSDIYALGVTLYHALALRLPFEGRNPAAMLRRIESGAATPLRNVNPRVPRDLETIVAKAMDADPTRRYQTAGDLAADLERFMNYQPVQARPAGLMTRSLKLVRRNRGAALGLTIGGFLAMGLAGVLVTWFFFVPGWTADHVRGARLILLDPGQANSIVSSLYWGRYSRMDAAAWDARLHDYDRALKEYDAALRLAPFDEAIRRERNVVAKSRSVPAPGNLPTAADRVDKTHRSAAMGVTEKEVTQATDPHYADPRSAGLFAFLTQDYDAALAAWAEYDKARNPLQTPDPLVDAAMGILYLFDEKAPLAYPRLQHAVEAFPGVRFLLEYLADAAVKCGDVDRAEQWLNEAKLLDNDLSIGARERIEAALLAARGRTDEAVAAYRLIINLGVPVLELARVLERAGRLDEALDAWMMAADRFPEFNRVRTALEACADRWWKSLSKANRRAEIESVLCHQYPQATRLFQVLSHLAATRIQTRTSGRIASGQFSLTSWPRATLASRFFPDFPPLGGKLSSPPLESLSLNELAERMEVENMSLWSRINAYPRILKEIQLAVWRRPTLRLMLSARLQILMATVVALLTGTKDQAHGQTVPGFVVQQYSTAENPFQLSFDGTGALFAGREFNNANQGGSSIQTYILRIAPGGGPAIQFGPATLHDPDAVAVDISGTISGTPGSILAGGYNEVTQQGTVAVVYPNATAATLFASTGYENIAEMKFDHAGRLLFSSGSFNAAPQGIFVSTGGPPTLLASQTPPPLSFAVDSQDMIYTSTSADGIIRKYASDGTLLNGSFATGVSGWVEFGPGGAWGTDLYCLNRADGILYRIDAQGALTQVGSGFPIGGATEDMAFGPDSAMYVSDWAGDRILRISPACTTPPCFQGLGDLPGGSTESYALGISADGTTVVGAGSSTASGIYTEGFRWQAATGMIALGDLLGNSYMSLANDVSADGSVIVGWSSSGNGTRADTNYAEAFRWTEAGGMVGLGDAPDGQFCSEAYCASSDGNIVGGHTHPANSIERATLWTNGAGWGPTADNTPNRYSVFYDISPNGQWAVGRISSPLEAIRWSAATGFQIIGDLVGGGTEALAFSVSQNGSIVVGYGSSASGQEAFRWTEPGGMTGLGDLPGGSFGSSASKVSPDGTLIVGNGHSGIGLEAAIWDESLVVSRLADVLTANGVSIPAGWTLTAARDITVNNNVVSICGYGTNPSGQTEAWIARYSHSNPCESADILQSPAPAGVPFGSAAQFNVVATGTGPLSYQWRKNNVPLTDGPVGCGGSISGATTDTLVLNMVSSVEAGSYDVVVTNACGSDTSTVAALTINPPPAAADVNHDGQVNGLDIQALVNALLAP